MAKRKRKKKKEPQAWSYTQWYVENRSEVLRRRRKRYASNEEVREAARDASKAWREKQPRSERPSGKRGLPRPKVVMLGGEPLELFSFGVLRQQTGLNKLTLTKWLQDGVLPEGYLVDRQNRRWFPEAFIDFVADMVTLRERERGGKFWFLKNFKTLVMTEWNNRLKKGKVPDLSSLKEG